VEGQWSVASVGEEIRFLFLSISREPCTECEILPTDPPPSFFSPLSFTIRLDMFK
jgi:hypothetical protein